MGDAHGLGGDSSHARACYQRGLDLLMRESKQPEIVLDAVLAIGDLHRAQRKWRMPWLYSSAVSSCEGLVSFVLKVPPNIFRCS